MRKPLLEWDKQQIVMYLSGSTPRFESMKNLAPTEKQTQPLDVLNIGLTHRLHITIGIASGAVAIGFLGIRSLWNKRRPPLSPFFTMFLVGNLIDLWNLVNLGRSL